jgi:hypothetical protein
MGLGEEGFSHKMLLASASSRMSAAAEMSPGMGAWCFFVGSAMFLLGPVDDPAFYNLVVNVWMVGSVFFAMEGCILAYRHFSGMSSSSS